MRRMSFGLTIDAFKAGTKDVTRRRATTWLHLKPGDRLTAVDRVMGFRKGQRAEILGKIEIVNVRIEPLGAIANEENGTAREGFPEMAPQEFIQMFRDSQGLGAGDDVRRVEFRKIDS